MLKQYEIVGIAFEIQLEKIKKLVELSIPALEKELDNYNSPWTPGRMPNWKK